MTKISGRTRLTTNFNLPSFYFRSSDYCRFYKFRNGGNILAAKLFFLLPASHQHCSSITPGNIDGADTTHKQYGTLRKAPQHNTGRPLLTLTYKHVPLSAGHQPLITTRTLQQPTIPRCLSWKEGVANLVLTNGIRGMVKAEGAYSKSQCKYVN